MPFAFIKNLFAKNSPTAIEAQKRASEDVTCPSFDQEPWKSRAAALRPESLDYYTLGPEKQEGLTPPPPLPPGHPYVKLVLEFLDTVPEACWVDEENEVD